MLYFGKSSKNFFWAEKNPTLSFKKVGILVQIPNGKSTLFWNHERSEVPRYAAKRRSEALLLELLVLHVLCRSGVYQSLSTWTTSLARSVLKPCSWAFLLERLVLHVLYQRRVHLTATPLPWQPRAKRVVMTYRRLQKCSPIFFSFYRNKVQVKKKYPIFENLRKTFSIGKKSDFKFQNRGFLRSKNVL